ncbi:hypothetical protein EYF80_024699 [Liparis tanakae]|uniref:Uncharacterized protein n=1 Tax=Liparis tanakae TaxID=230148 RepID=A0A4Z2HHS5_9TELE|nr:hypothetical protein EYF80_024699 [Liparis tanakae]
MYPARRVGSDSPPPAGHASRRVAPPPPPGHGNEANCRGVQRRHRNIPVPILASLSHCNVHG